MAFLSSIDPLSGQDFSDDDVLKGPPIKGIMTRNVVTVSEDMPLQKAIDLIALLRISCVIIVQAGKPVGIVTERDIVGLASRRMSVHEPVKSFLLKEVVTIDEDESILEAASLMDMKSLRRLLVVDEQGDLTGIVTQSDIIQSLGPYYSLCFRDVSSVMTRTIFALDKKCLTSQAVQEMSQQQISCVVILEGKRPIGMFTERDVVNLIRKGVQWEPLPLDVVMSRPVISVRRDTNLLDAIRLFRENQVRRLLVVDEAGNFDGILTQTSIVRKLKFDYVDSLKRVISRQNEAIDETEAKYQTLVESALIGIIIIKDGVIQFINPKFQQMLGTPMESVLGRDLQDFVFPDDCERMKNHLQTILTGKPPLQEMTTEFRLVGEDAKRLVHVEGNWVTIRYEGAPAVLATLKDISLRKKSEEEIKRLIITDELTGIYNHRHFVSELEREIDKANRYHNTFSLLFSDIDNFKEFNDQHGHLEGDHLLQTIAQIFRAEVRGSDLVFRYGGEEYTVLMPSTTIEQSAVLAERVCRAVAVTPFTITKGNVTRLVHSSVSIGVAEFLPGDDANQIIRKADQAMYQAKKNGKNRVECFREG